MSAPASPEPVSEASGNRALIGRVFRDYLVPRWRELGLAIALATIVAVSTGFLAQILEPAINRLIVTPDRTALWQIPLAIVVNKQGRVISMNARGPELARILERELGPIPEAKTDEKIEEKK